MGAIDSAVAVRCEEKVKPPHYDFKAAIKDGKLPTNQRYEGEGGFTYVFTYCE